MDNTEPLTWRRVKTEKSEEPVARRYHSGVLFSGKMFVFGGTGGGKEARNDFYSFHIDSAKWEIVVPGSDVIPPERFAHVALVNGSKMYLHGGNGGMGYLAKDDFFSFDFQTNQWSAIEAPNKPPKRYHHSGFVYKSKIYIFGGCQTNKIFLNDLYSFDVETQTWEKLEIPGAPIPRAGQTTFVIGSKLCLYGGNGGDGGYDFYFDMFTLDLDHPDKWEPVEFPEEAPKPESGRPIVSTASSEFGYIFGGSDGKKPSRNFWKFDPKTSTFTNIPIWMEMDVAHIAAAVTGSKGMEPTPRYGHCAVLEEHKKEITVYAGSGSMYLSDVIQISLE